MYGASSGIGLFNESLLSILCSSESKVHIIILNICSTLSGNEDIVTKHILECVSLICLEISDISIWFHQFDILRSQLSLLPENQYLWPSASMRTFRSSTLHGLAAIIGVLK